MSRVSRAAEEPIREGASPRTERESPCPAVLFMIGGLSDIDVATNQSLKNTVKYLSQFGHRIHYFGAFPVHYRTLQSPEEIFNDRVEFHRFPDFLTPLFDLAKFLKDAVGMARKKKDPQSMNLKAAQKVRYYDEYNFLGHLCYIVFFFIYAPIEMLRVSYYCFKCSPSLFYGINVQGSALAALLAKIFGKPVIQRWHGCSFTEEDIDRIRISWADKLLLLDGRFAKWLPSDAVVVTNDGSRGDKIFPLIGVPPEKLHFWMNGIDLEDMALPPDWNAGKFKASLGFEGKRILLMVTRLVLWKRVDRGLDCVYRLVQKHSMKEDIQMLILGEGQEADILQAKARELGLSQHVRFMGAVPHQEVAEYFSIADVFLSLCDMMNLVNPVLEAMYSGVPIVSVDDGSTSELLENGENAFLIAYDRLEDELPLKVKALLTDTALSQRMADNARRTFQEKVLSWEDRMLLEYQLIQELISNKPSLRRPCRPNKSDGHSILKMTKLQSDGVSSEPAVRQGL